MRGYGFDPRPVRVRFVVDKLAVVQVALVLRGFPVSIILPVLHTNLYLHNAVTGMRNGQVWETSKCVSPS